MTSKRIEESLGGIAMDVTKMHTVFPGEPLKIYLESELFNALSGIWAQENSPVLFGCPVKELKGKGALWFVSFGGDKK